MTVFDAYNRSVQRLIEALNLPRDEACARARLLLDQIVQTRHAHLLVPLQELAEDQLSRWQTLLGEALSGRPLPYILGEWEFWGLGFRVDERVLIPRPETEILVEATLQRLKNIDAPRIGDLGTGSGCIAISLAHERSDATVIATDLSSDSLQLAQQNAARLGVKNRIEWRIGEIGNWGAPLQAAASTCRALFDAIVSNPPYIPAREIENLQIEVRAYEPRRALDGGADGVRDYRLMATQLKPFLKPDGFLALEFGHGQFATLREIFENEGWQVGAPLCDNAGLERALIATKKE